MHFPIYSQTAPQHPDTLVLPIQPCKKLSQGIQHLGLVWPVLLLLAYAQTLPQQLLGFGAAAPVPADQLAQRVQHLSLTKRPLVMFEGEALPQQSLRLGAAAPVPPHELAQRVQHLSLTTHVAKCPQYGKTLAQHPFGLG